MSTAMVEATADELVALVTPHDGQHRRNFARQVVCELRFPTLLAFAEMDPPKTFVTALRKKYPILELGKEVLIAGTGESAPAKHSHILKSAKGDWTVTLKKDAVAIETTRYTVFKDMRLRVAEVLEALVPVIDADFFTRVGLRYVNLVTTDGESPLAEWINPALVGPTVDMDRFKNISELAGRFRLTGGDGGGCYLQHGLKLKEGRTKDGIALVPDYVVDIDSYREEVLVKDTLATLDRMRLQAYSLFDWSIGERARNYLLSDKV
jgi:uncharacterized protein (TIGR04255 family)